jgi:hypothetical protein
LDSLIHVGVPPPGTPHGASGVRTFRTPSRVSKTEDDSSASVMFARIFSKQWAQRRHCSIPACKQSILSGIMSAGLGVLRHDGRFFNEPAAASIDPRSGGYFNPFDHRSPGLNLCPNLALCDVLLTYIRNYPGGRSLLQSNKLVAPRQSKP